MINIKLPKIVKPTKRVGRGPASGKGKTSGRGMNGQKCRTGSSTLFKEGGQTNFIMRLPKRSPLKAKKRTTVIVSSDQLKVLFKAGEKVTKDELVKRLKINLKNPQFKVINGIERVNYDIADDISTSKSFKK
jgi:large subunit ribosomal protein L15